VAGDVWGRGPTAAVEIRTGLPYNTWRPVALPRGARIEWSQRFLEKKKKRKKKVLFRSSEPFNADVMCFLRSNNRLRSTT